MSNPDLDELEAELGGPLEVQAKPKLSPEEARVVAGFEEIVAFFSEHGRAPLHGENRDIFERLYATRLDTMRRQTRFHHLLAQLDLAGLLQANVDNPESMSEDELLEELGGKADDIAQLRHVKPRSEVRAVPDDVAQRKQCVEFEKFKPLFQQISEDLKTGTRQTRPFGKDTEILSGQFFVVGGQIACIASVGEELRAPNGEWDARLRVIYSNGTESDLLRRSMQRALYKDEAGRRITELETKAGPLFATPEADTIESGTIYVLRSQSNLPLIAENRELVHKIGVTGGKVETRISNAKYDPTYLLADVEIVAAYELFNINRSKLERLIQKFFESAQLDIEIKDRFGKPVKPREWFMVPLSVIDEAVARIKDHTITEHVYDASKAEIVRGSQRQ
jgi:T5orf172 domain-containing protein